MYVPSRKLLVSPLMTCQYIVGRETDGPCETCGKHFGGDSSHPFLGKQRVCGHEESEHVEGVRRGEQQCTKCWEEQGLEHYCCHAYQPCATCNGTGAYSESGRGSDGPEPCPVCSGEGT